jgi:proteasome lid subunit RPN8/RPN11
MPPQNPVLAKVFLHAERCYPNEAVGALLSKDTTIVEAVEAVNIADDANRFEVDPSEVLRIQKQADQNGFEIVGWYHSHPDGEPIPSKLDAECAFEGQICMIVSVKQGTAAEYRCWRFEGGNYKQVSAIL